MNSEVPIIPLSRVTKHTNCGSKARNLAGLLKMDIRVPTTYVLPFEAYDAYSQNQDKGRVDIRGILAANIDTSKSYSVRSSANVEDTALFSFAGQFETQLNVNGPDSLVNAIKAIWGSAQSENVNSYQRGLGHSGKELKMAVMIQEMVEPVFSGVVFTRNPITGLDEVIVETVDGYGDLLVQEGVTPDRWVFKWGKLVEQPEGQEGRVSIIESVMDEAITIATKEGFPVDMEWVYDGQDVVWLQMREITTLRNTNIYSNKISREFLPGIIKPLVWSVNIPVVNSSWKRLFMELLGGDAEGIDIKNLSRSFYYRAYFNMGVIGDLFELLGMPRQALEILAGIEVPEGTGPGFRPGPRTIKYLPRLLMTAMKKLFYSKEIELFLREKKRAYRSIYSMDLNSMKEEELLDVVDQLFELNSSASYVVIVSQLLNSLYNRILSGMLAKHDIDYDALTFPEAKRRLFPIDPRQNLEALNEAYRELDREAREMVKQAKLDEVLSRRDLGDFREQLTGFVRRFGHLSDSGNDFSTSTWREDPYLILGMVTEYEPAEGEDAKSSEQERLETLLDENVFLRMMYRRASKYREYRESVNFLYVYGYGLFRRVFKRIEELFLNKRLLDSVDDIFYLTYDEVRSLVQDSSLAEALQSRIRERQVEVERFRDVRLPDVIYNELPETALLQRNVLRDMKGVATSKGHFVGPARVVRGAGDFGKIQEGDVLVIPYSDVSWTPLFSKAAAVVSESGGILSHCSIVAREYGIPAVVSVKGAMDLKDGTSVAVDGYSGKVMVVED